MIIEDIINFNRLRKTSIPYELVKKHNGTWNHNDWLDFCSQISDAGYYPINLNRVGSLLESLKKEL